VLTPTHKGNIAEAKITASAIELGIGVCRPVGEGCRYDLIFDLRPRLLRVQCKSAPQNGDVIVVRYRTSRYTPGKGYVRSLYGVDEVDAIAIYCPDLDRCYLLPFPEFAGCGFAHLRLERSRNNQERGVRMAADYEFGAIAQLGERVTGSHEVAGSNPASSTSRAACPGGPRLFELAPEG
jgi:hypothetical protein